MGWVASAPAAGGTNLCPQVLGEGAAPSTEPSVTWVRFVFGQVAGPNSGCPAGREARTYLRHGDHALVGDGVCADAEVARRVPTDDAVDGVPVWGVRLISVDHGQVCHHRLHPVFRHFACVLPSVRKEMVRSRGRAGAGRGQGGLLCLPLLPGWRFPRGAHPVSVLTRWPLDGPGSLPHARPASLLKPFQPFHMQRGPRQTPETLRMCLETGPEHRVAAAEGFPSQTTSGLLPSRRPQQARGPGVSSCRCANNQTWSLKPFSPATEECGLQPRPSAGVLTWPWQLVQARVGVSLRPRRRGKSAHLSAGEHHCCADAAPLRVALTSLPCSAATVSKFLICEQGPCTQCGRPVTMQCASEPQNLVTKFGQISGDFWLCLQQPSPKAGHRVPSRCQALPEH